jgi:hypothetical protein
MIAAALFGGMLLSGNALRAEQTATSGGKITAATENKTRAVNKIVPEVINKAMSKQAGTSSVGDKEYRLSEVQVLVAPDAPLLALRAADEICRYVFLLSGKWHPVAPHAVGDGKIVIRTGADAHVPGDGPDPSQNFALYVENGNQVVHGASPVATLWAAYELIESWGVGFYLGGDQLPKCDPAHRVAFVERTCKPALTIRGNVPWCNFANSPTSWNPQDYRTFLEQMAKQKANFIGFHSYDHEPFAAYFPAKNVVKGGGRFMQANTKIGRIWSPRPWGAWNGLFGTDQFFNCDNWGSEIAAEESNNAVAVQAQQQAMIDALAYARTRLGMKTCMGFEVKNVSTDPAVVAEFVAKMTHVLEAYPLDYVWVWQPEAQSVHHKDRKPESEVSEEVRQAFGYLDREYHDLHEAQRMLGWMRLAYKTVKEKKPTVKLVISGWGGERYLKFSDYYLGLDKLLPKDIVFSALDQIDPWHMDRQPEPYRRVAEAQLRKKPTEKSTFNVAPGNYVAGVYGQLAPERQRWPIPWFESDGYRNSDQTAPQPNVLAFEDILKDIKAKGCQGALGIHWRTRNVQDVAGYLYRFGWQPSLSAQAYLKDYARHLYGPELAERMSDVHLQLERYGAAYVGASGTTECASPFWWFSPRFGFPDKIRLEELKKLRDELRAKSTALGAGRSGTSIELSDLANTIHWLVIRAETGTQIWDDGRVVKEAPLAKRLRDAEELAKNGETEKAKQAALLIALVIEKLDFKNALPALAATSRTRGELGALVTATQRYGRYYAEFVDRLRKLTGSELLPYKTGWLAGEIHNTFPVPNEILLGESVNFDAVLLPAALPRACAVELMLLEPAGAAKVVLPLKVMGGAYQRATFTPKKTGTWSWRLYSDQKPNPNELPWPAGVLTVRPGDSGFCDC